MNIRQGLIFFNAVLIGVVLAIHINFLMIIGLCYITFEAYNGAKSKDSKNV